MIDNVVEGGNLIGVYVNYVSVLIYMLPYGNLYLLFLPVASRFDIFPLVSRRCYVLGSHLNNYYRKQHGSHLQNSEHH